MRRVESRGLVVCERKAWTVTWSTEQGHFGAGKGNMTSNTNQAVCMANSDIFEPDCGRSHSKVVEKVFGQRRGMDVSSS